MPRRILIDLLGYTGTRGGTETYVRQLTPRIGERLPGIELVALANRVGAERVRGFFPGRVVVADRIGESRADWARGELFEADRAARTAGAALMWCPANFAPVRRGVPRVVTVHDITYREVPGTGLERIARALTFRLMVAAARSADTVITGSEAAAEQIRTVMRVPADRIHVVPHGTTAAQAPDDPWAALAELGVTPDRPLVLSTGNRLPHKNFEGLLAAVATIPPRERPRVVITGSHGDDPLRADVARLGLQDDVVLAGWVSTEQLESLFAAASLYACPSLTEGFGLPVVDAMRRGCLVLANDIPVLREVGGDAALYADAGSPAAFGAAIRSALAAPDAAARRAAGHAHAAAFTWEASADRTADILARALDNGGRA